MRGETEMIHSQTRTFLAFFRLRSVVVRAHQVHGSFSCVSDDAESVAEVQCSEFSTDTA